MVMRQKSFSITAFFGRFRRAKKGATAVEFAFIAGPFLLLLFALVEISLVFFASTALEHAGSTVARKIRTGELQADGATSARFITEVCAEMNAIIPCGNNVSIDVRTFADFDNVSSSNPINADGGLDSQSLQFNPGISGDIVLVRIFYTWKLNTPIIGAAFANMDNNQRLIIASVVFRNEPFGPA